MHRSHSPGNPICNSMIKSVLMTVQSNKKANRPRAVMTLKTKLKITVLFKLENEWSILDMNSEDHYQK
jgi:hypothetical protein